MPTWGNDCAYSFGSCKVGGFFNLLDSKSGSLNKTNMRIRVSMGKTILKAPNLAVRIAS